MWWCVVLQACVACLLQVLCGWFVVVSVSVCWEAGAGCCLVVLEGVVCVVEVS